MNSINELDHPLYKSSLTRTQNIDGKLKKTRLNCLINNCSIVGTKNDILLHLKGGPAKNLINTFFKYTTDKCDYCGIQKSKTIQLDRSHCNKDSCDRSSLLQRSINYHFIDQSAPIKIKDILITFVKYHKDIPLFILCKKCHREYDK
tara:strand:- start:424 stop:864 length:441 start_codon:yes stop_codon:yes gene_type:complete